MTEQLINYIQNELVGKRKNITIAPTDNLLGSGLVDSMGIMKLITFIEKEFGIKVPPQDMIIENFMSVEAISTYLNKRKIA